MPVDVLLLAWCLAKEIGRLKEDVRSDDRLDAVEHGAIGREVENPVAKQVHLDAPGMAQARRWFLHEALNARGRLMGPRPTDRIEGKGETVPPVAQRGVIQTAVSHGDVPREWAGGRNSSDHPR